MVRLTPGYETRDARRIIDHWDCTTSMGELSFNREDLEICSPALLVKSDSPRDGERQFRSILATPCIINRDEADLWLLMRRMTNRSDTPLTTFYRDGVGPRDVEVDHSGLGIRLTRDQVKVLRDICQDFLEATAP